MTRILAVDDSRTLREMLTNCLTAAGHEVFTACDGAEGLAALRDKLAEARGPSYEGSVL